METGELKLWLFKAKQSCQLGNSLDFSLYFVPVRIQPDQHLVFCGVLLILNNNYVAHVKNMVFTMS
jgi:hypothetical protein